MCAEGPPPVGLGCDVADQEVGCRRGPLRLAIWCSLPRGGEEKRGGRGGILKTGHADAGRRNPAPPGVAVDIDKR